jgi:predicted alpha-1,2-mannosidase
VLNYSIVAQENITEEFDTSLLTYVNPFIGTSNGGNTFPGAVVPWGMVSVSPHNSLSAPSGYIYGEEYIYGFGLVHLSGTGCAELGSVLITITDDDQAIKPDLYKNIYSSEKASPGYYKVVLDGQKLKIEVTSTGRVGFLKFTSFDKSNKTLVIDAGRSLGIIGGGYVSIVSDNEVEGFNISGGFCGEDNREKVYFVARFSRKFKKEKLWSNEIFLDSKKAEIENYPIGALLNYDFDENQELFVKVGISYVSIENARMNLEEEIMDWNFERVRDKARSSWDDKLMRILIKDDNRDNLIKFYSAFYHMLIHPNIISDVNGEYPLMGRNGIGKYSDRNRFSIFSLWDTYRTLHPFLTLFFPEVQSDVIKTMIDMYKECGYLPKWELAGNETYMMVGDPASIVIADSYLKGITDFDFNLAFEAMLKPTLLNQDENAPPIRAGYHELLQYGYIPFEQDWSGDWWVWGPVSTTLEYCLSDFAISRMASKLGMMDIEDKFYNRSLSYKNLFDPSTSFMRPKLKNGEWMEPFDPLVTEGSGDWIGAGGAGYVEGNAWNYTWFVPHDIPGLISIFGGEKSFSKKLYQSFTNGQFTINNEPDIAYPYLFNYVNGEEHKTRELVLKIINDEFGIDHNGLPGNDDCGTISGWLLFSSIGFYPACPGSQIYQIGISIFDKIKLQLSPEYYSGSDFVITKIGENSEMIKVNELNGEVLEDHQILHNQIVSGGELKFYFE